VHEQRERALFWALVINFVVHGLALVSMAAFLLPALPGGTAHSDAERIVAIAEHPWRFRLGWFPWQLCALADLWLAISMVRVDRFPRLGKWLVLIFTAIAVVPDQLGQAIWITRGVELAEHAPGSYLDLEREIFPLTAAWGALFYTCAALGWTWCFIAAGYWSRVLGVLSVTLWSSMVIAVVSPLLPISIRPAASFVSTMNGVGFVQLQLWLALVAHRVWRALRSPS
jgi:hypothetical protein